MNIIEIKDLNFKYDDKTIFENLNLNIEKGSFTTVIGNNGSGKSTLVKILVGLLKASGEIKINDIVLDKENIKEIRKLIGVVFENPDNQFVAETVMDDIGFSLENLQIKPREIRVKIKEVANYIGISHLLDKEPHSLSGGEKQLVALASALVHEPKILILDEALTMVDVRVRKQIYAILNDLNKNKGVTIINVTHDMDEVLYGSDIVLISKGAIVLKGKKEAVLKEEKVFNALGLDLPFMVSLSIKLMYYGLINRVIFDMDEMVNEIWK